MISARTINVRVPVIAWSNPPFESGSVGVARAMSWVKRLKLMPGRPFFNTVARILAAGITVTIAPIATNELTSASFAAAFPRWIPLNAVVKIA